MKFRSMIYAIVIAIAVITPFSAFAIDDAVQKSSEVEQLKQTATDIGAKALKEQLQAIQQTNAKSDQKQVQHPSNDQQKTKLDAQVANALQNTAGRLNNLSDDEKEKLLDDLNHPDGKTVGQGMSEFGKEIGQGLGSAVRELGTTFNDFANSGVGKITAAIIGWKLFGHQLLWFIFICFLMMGLGRGLRYIFGQYSEAGKFIKYDLTVFNKLDDGVVFGIFLTVIGTLFAIVVGAGANL